MKKTILTMCILSLTACATNTSSQNGLKKSPCACVYKSIPSSEYQNTNPLVSISPDKARQKSQSDQEVIVNDRVIIEKADKENTYSTTILAKGVFTAMTFNSDNGLLCGA